MKTLIILHGWQSSKERWQAVKQNVENNNIKVIVPDIPGFKPKTKLITPWNLDNYVEWLNKLLIKQKVDNKFYLLGHSFGGRVSIKFAERFPQKLNGLILVAAVGIKKKRLSGGLMKKGAVIGKKLGIEEGDNIGQFLKKVFYRIILRKVGFIRTSGTLEQTMSNVIDEDLTPLLSNILIPTLIIWGKKDKLAPVSDGKLMLNKIKNSEIKIFNKIGHTLHLVSSKALAKEIKKFINKI